jgi:hypothetical protein
MTVPLHTRARAVHDYSAEGTDASLPVVRHP